MSILVSAEVIMKHIRVSAKEKKGLRVASVSILFRSLLQVVILPLSLDVVATTTKRKERVRIKFNIEEKYE